MQDMVEVCLCKGFCLRARDLETRGGCLKVRHGVACLLPCLLPSYSFHAQYIHVTGIFSDACSQLRSDVIYLLFGLLGHGRDENTSQTIAGPGRRGPEEP